MTDDMTQPNSQIERPFVFNYPVVEPPTPAPAPRQARRVNIKLYWAVLAIVGAVAISGAVTFLATRPSVNSVNQELAATQLSLSHSEDKLVAQTETTDTCVEAVDKSAKTLDHWYSYMDDVQGLFLAQTQTDIKQAMTHLTGSYRSVVADKVSTASAIRNCQSANK